MGVLHGRDLLSAKWITAIISDASHRVHFIPIKHTIGDYFVTDIDDEIYAFKIDGRRILQYRESMVKTFRILQYDITHYLPLSSESKELEMVLEENKLPKVDGMLANIFKILGSKEKADFKTHKLTELIDKITQYEKDNPNNDNRFSKEAMNMINYLDHLSVNQIVTPLKKVSEFIQEDLIATDPKFMGTVVASYQRTDIEHKKVTNTPLKAKQAWIKFIAIFMGIGLVVTVAFFVYDGGYLDNFGGNMVPSMNFGEISDAELMKKYPDGASMRAAVDSGELDYNKLSDNAKAIVDSTPSLKVVENAEPPPTQEPKILPKEENLPEPIIIENP